MIAEKSDLGFILKTLFNDISEKGHSRIKIGQQYNFKNIVMPLHLNFALPHKHYNTANQAFYLAPEHIEKLRHTWIKKAGSTTNELEPTCNLKPYHSLLLSNPILRENSANSFDEEIREKITRFMKLTWGDSPIITRFIAHVRNNISIEEIAREADMALKTAMRAAVHLIIHNIAMPIFPIRPNSVYIISPHAKLELLQDRLMENGFQRLKKQYFSEWGGSLVETVGAFSCHYSLDERIKFSENVGNYDKALEFMRRLVTWLYRKKFLLQIHTYPFLMIDIEEDDFDNRENADNGANEETFKKGEYCKKCEHVEKHENIVKSDNFENFEIRIEKPHEPAADLTRAENVIKNNVIKNINKNQTTISETSSESTGIIAPDDEFSYLLQFNKLTDAQQLKIRKILKNIEQPKQKHIIKNVQEALTAFEPCLHMFTGKHHLDELYWRLDNRVRLKFNTYLECLQKVDVISLVEFEDSVCAPFVTDNYLFIPGL